MTQFRRRTLSRLAAVQALFQSQLRQERADQTLKTFLTDANRLQENALKGIDQDLFTRVVKGVEADKENLDALIQNHLTADWAFSRLDNVIRVVLEAAAFELLHMPDTPAPIIMNEYIDITESFMECPQARGFVNGVLNALAATLRG